jgi:hypothetical protein
MVFTVESAGGIDESDHMVECTGEVLCQQDAHKGEALCVRMSEISTFSVPASAGDSSQRPIWHGELDAMLQCMIARRCSCANLCVVYDIYYP